MAKIKINAGYAAIHLWVRKHKPKPKFCEMCNENKPVEIGSINGKCLRNINNYKWFCNSCHSKYDDMKINLGNYSKGLKEKLNPNWKGGKRQFICKFCSKVLRRYLSQVKNIDLIFCSALCANRYLYLNFIKRDLNTGRFK